MTSIDQQGLSLNSGQTFSSPNPHYNPTFESFELVSSPVWWEANTNMLLDGLSYQKLKRTDCPTILPIAEGE